MWWRTAAALTFFTSFFLAVCLSLSVSGGWSFRNIGRKLVKLTCSKVVMRWIGLVVFKFGKTDICIVELNSNFHNLWRLSKTVAGQWTLAVFDYGPDAK